MSPRDYCFWLMGAFELVQSKTVSLTCENTMNEMSEHLSLVLADTSEAYQHRYPDDCVGMNFCRWLDERLSQSDSCLTATQLDRIHERLCQVFITEIDPSFGNSARLQDIHDGLRR